MTAIASARPLGRADLRRRSLPVWSLWAGLAFIAVVTVLGFVLPAIVGYGPNDFVAAPLQAPSLQYPFGTDAFGRDVMLRTFVAAKVDYFIGAFVAVVCATLGSIVGVAVAVSSRPGVDWAVMRTVDAIIAFPLMILVLATAVILGSGLTIAGLPAGLPSILVIYSLTGWAYYARLARSQARSIRSKDYVTAARLMGYSDLRITLKHVLPTVMMTSLAYAVGDAIIAISLAAGLSFFGAGILPPTPEWGQMIFDGRSLMATSWWLVSFPILMLVLSGFAFSAIASGLIKKLDG